MATRLIEVSAWDQLVGALAPDPRLGCFAFEYAPSWIKTGIELAPLTMPLARARVFVFPTLPEPTFRRLPGLIADSLPDVFGNAIIDAWMAGKGLTRESITTLDRLAYMGRRGLGALTFRPEKGSRRESAAPLEMRALVEAARRAVHGSTADDREAKSALADLIRVGTSAGGARAKAVVAWNPTTAEIRSGQFDVEAGFEHWLLKFDGIGNDVELGAGASYGRIEFAYHRLAHAAGITMEPCRLLEEGDRAHFMTRRFDRTGNTKHHLQTLGAMQHLDYKLRATHAYEQLFLTARALKLGDDAFSQLFLRMAFNVMARNCDDHVKNFAFRLRRGESWELAPAYDVTHAHNPRGYWTAQHLMSVNGRFDDITREDLLIVAERFSVRRAADKLAAVRAALDNWSQCAAEAGLQAVEADLVAKDFRPL
jgi:serine/threonine-protein kinase HipA